MGVFVSGGTGHSGSYIIPNLITRQALGWEPAQPSLLTDLDNGHYFPAG